MSSTERAVYKATIMVLVINLMLFFAIMHEIDRMPPESLTYTFDIHENIMEVHKPRIVLHGDTLTVHDNVGNHVFTIIQEGGVRW